MGVRNSFSRKEVIKSLKILGCVFVRQGKGSHELRYNPDTDATFVLAFHAGKPMKE
ncbi:type II toxin-antitoxin system HicA family toxin [Chryseobacterium oryctis]|uniref:Type II toxin-antitoxin system HicA family toxin n=1 Tax=Chryseobacterium oryctis TaxID=2952618 RepID=A0ABT3HIR1_9FLAO|nr:type II toxin-antitoxin system HicA family toxin [Chryseobacterium oryctis]MCW3159663.1 type II toxin-antitoxin system HicA family toxin [Chryseobacterium oryctis]